MTTIASTATPPAAPHTLTVDAILKLCTVERVCAMTQTEADALYPAVRDGLHDAYQDVGPRAGRRLANELSRLTSAASRAAGTRTAESLAGRANAVEAAFVDARSDYDRAADAKHLLAIRAGNYDGRLPQPCKATPGTREWAIQKVTAVRRVETGELPR